MKAAALKNLIPASALALSLMAFTSCRIEKLVPELEPYLKKVAGSETNSHMSASTAITSNGSNTEEFKMGFKAGYDSGFAESASKTTSIKSRVSTSSDFNEGFRAGYTAGYSEGAKPSRGNVAHNTTLTPLESGNYTPPVTFKTNALAPAPASVAAVSSRSSTPSEIPSWGYTSEIGLTATESEPSASFNRPSASSKSPTRSSSQSSSRTYSSSRSRGGCAGGT